MKYTDDRIINATTPNHMMVPNDVLQRLLLEKERDKVLLNRARVAMISGSIVLIGGLIYFYYTHRKMKKENREIKDYFETMVPLVSNITAKLNYNPDGKSTTTDRNSEQTKVTAELDAEHEPNANSEFRQPEAVTSKRDDLEDNSGK